MSRIFEANIDINVKIRYLKSLCVKLTRCMDANLIIKEKKGKNIETFEMLRYKRIQKKCI